MGLRRMVLITMMGSMLPSLVLLAVYVWIALYPSLGQKRYWWAWVLAFGIDTAQYWLTVGGISTSLWFGMTWRYESVVAWLLTVAWLIELYRVAVLYRGETWTRGDVIIPLLAMTHPLLFYCGIELPTAGVLIIMMVTIAIPFVRIALAARGWRTAVVYGSLGVLYGISDRIAAYLAEWGQWDYYSTVTLAVTTRSASTFIIAVVFLTIHLAEIADELTEENEVRRGIIEIITTGHKRGQRKMRTECPMETLSI